MWKAGSHDLIFMDERMPLLRGSAATEIIRGIEAKEGRGRTAIIAVTASVFEQDRDAILAHGADDVVIKPFAESDIFNALFLPHGRPFRSRSCG